MNFSKVRESQSRHFLAALAVPRSLRRFYQTQCVPFWSRIAALSLSCYIHVLFGRNSKGKEKGLPSFLIKNVFI